MDHLLIYKSITRFISISIIGVLLLSCSSPSQVIPNLEDDPIAATITLTEMSPAEKSPDLTPTSEMPESSKPEFRSGSILLIQTGVDAYHLLDPITHEMVAMEFPGNSREIRLSSSLSPSGKVMLIVDDFTTFNVIDVLTQQVTLTYQHQVDSTGFALEQAAANALIQFPAYSLEMAKSAIEKTITSGHQNIRWYKNDHTVLMIDERSGTTTNLALLDLETGVIQPLEHEPLLVEDYWVGPGDDKILLKKGFSNAPSDWQDDQYYLMDLTTGTSQKIPLPDNIDNPSLFWFSSELIGMIHQIGIGRNIDFSLVDITNMESQLIVNEPFSGIYTFGADILTLYQDRENQKTTLTRRSLTGEIQTEIDLDWICSVKRKITGTSLILNCETDSFLIEGENLSISDFGSSIFLISRSPDRQNFVIVTERNTVFMISTDLTQREVISLEGEPLEILWLPDSSGFLYRTATDLYHYNIHKQTNEFILSSDLFGDYRNLNAVWIDYD
jgi:hypothetical protein